MDESHSNSMDLAGDRDSHQIVDQGVRALAVLSKQVELIAAQTRRAELEAALAQARRGQTMALRQWLAINKQTIAVDTGPIDVVTPHVLPHVELTSELVHEDRDDETHAQPDSTPAPQKTDFAGANNKSNAVGSPVEATPTGNNALTSKPIVVSKKQKLGKPQPHSQSQPKPLVKELNLKEFGSLPEATSSRRAKQNSRWQLRGMMISTLFHLFLIADLALVTVAIPQLGGILQFEASESPEPIAESIEVVSNVDVQDAAEQIETPTSNFQPTFDSDLPALGDIAVQSSDLEPTNVSSTMIKMPSAMSTTAAMSMRAPKNLGAQFFGASASGGFFCFLIDGSASMKGGAWEAARAELIRSLTSLSEKQRYYVMFYNRDELNRVIDPETNQPARTGLYATKENLQTTVNWLGMLQVGPGGGQSDVIKAALELEPDAIFYLTDGEMTTGVQDYIFKMLRNENRVSDIVEGQIVRVPINAIAYHSDSGLSFMQQVANENRGQFKYVPKPVSQNPKSRKR